MTSKHAPKGALERPVLEAMVAEEMPVRGMGRRLGRSPNTIRYWLNKYGLPVPNGRGGRPRLHDAGGSEPATIESRCRTHGLTVFGRRSDGYYRCRKCGVEAVTRRRRAVRQVLVEEAGGACVLCGYDRPSGLEFHHLDPARKEFGLSARGVTRSLAALRAEAAKCILVCSNCHAEVESGERRLPAELTAVKLSDIGS